MNRDPVYEGQKLTIRYVELADESCPVEDFLEGLSPSDRVKIDALVELMGDHYPITNKEKFKKVEDSDKIFELKSFQIRILGFFAPGRVFWLAVALRKKKDKLKRSDVVRAEGVKNWFFDAGPGGEV